MGHRGKAGGRTLTTDTGSAGAALPSWRDGETRRAILEFVERIDEIALEDRIAVLDNDGTLWCERPLYPQAVFFADQLRAATSADPSLAEREEYRAVIEGDLAAAGEIGLERIALALVEMFDGITPEEFIDRVRGFFATQSHAILGIPYTRIVYQPMLELIDLLRSVGFRVFVVTAGGADFVRAVSERLYGVEPERVIGSRVGYQALATGDGIRVARTQGIDGRANEGIEKIPNIYRHVGKRPVFAAGNSPGDAEMLRYVADGDGRTLSMIVDHDDGEREFTYESVAGTFESALTMPEMARRFGWTVVSMRDDWTTVFPPDTG